MPIISKYVNHPFSSYQELESYNSNSPMLPPTVPSSKFQTILEQDYEKQPYDVLTYQQKSGVQYPSVETAYPLLNPSYVVRKTPQNKFVREFTGNAPNNESASPQPVQNKDMCPIPNIPVVENFKSDAEKLKELNVILFVDKNCKFCKQQLTKISHELFVIKDIGKRENKQEFTNYGGFATPYFFSKETNRSFTGLLLSEGDIVKKLETKEYFVPPNEKLCQNLKDLDLQLYMSHGCPYCDNLKQLLRDQNALSSVTIIDNLAEVENPPVIKGWPTIISKKTGKQMMGSPPDLELLISHLS